VVGRVEIDVDRRMAVVGLLLRLPLDPADHRAVRARSRTRPCPVRRSPPPPPQRGRHRRASARTPPVWRGCARGSDVVAHCRPESHRATIDDVDVGVHPARVSPSVSGPVRPRSKAGSSFGSPRRRRVGAEQRDKPGFDGLGRVPQ
jgi:hypothetical protein